jgi:hypothetical protein
MQVMRGFVRTSSGTRLARQVDGLRGSGLLGKEILCVSGYLPDLSPFFVHFARFHVHHADHLSVEDSMHDALFYNKSII